MRGGHREFEGETLQDTLRAAASQLGIDEADIHYKILETGRKGILGFGAKKVRILVECPEPAKRKQSNEPRNDRRPRQAAGDRDGSREGSGETKRRRPRRRRGRGAEATADAVEAPRDAEASREDSGDEDGRREGTRGRRRGRGRGRRGRGRGERAASGDNQEARPREQNTREEAGREEGGREDGDGRRGRGRGRGRGGERGRRRGRGDRPQRSRRPAEPLGEPDERPVFMDQLEGTVQQMFSLIEMPLDVSGEYREASGCRLKLDGDGLRAGDGELVNSVQFLLNRMSRRTWPDSGRIQLICEGVEDRRDDDIVDMAREVAERVIASGKAERLQPMNPYERRLVHMTIRSMKGVSTRSEGDTFEKRIRVTPKRRRRRGGGAAPAADENEAREEREARPDDQLIGTDGAISNDERVRYEDKPVEVADDKFDDDDEVRDSN